MNSLHLLQSIGSCMHDITVSHGLPLSLFIAGLVGGFTHCVAMCGPFVLSQTGHIEKIRDSILLPYHLGRITTYTVLAVLLASVLNLAFLFLPIRAYIIAPVLMTAGLIFVIGAFPSLGRLFPWLVDLRVSVPYRFLSKGFARLSENKGVFQKFFMGMLLGFVPCGMIVAALMAATTAPSAMQAGIAMAAFGLGTMPALIVTASSGQILKRKFPRTMQRVSQGLMVWSAIWLFALAGMVLI